MVLVELEVEHPVKPCVCGVVCRAVLGLTGLKSTNSENEGEESRAEADRAGREGRPHIGLCIDG
jgi:hypothetical protein